MHVLFEVHIAPGVDPDRLLPDDVLQSAKVKPLTWSEARATGFANLPEPPAGKQVRYISAIGRDARFVHHVLENNPGVTSIRTYDVS